MTKSFFAALVFFVASAAASSAAKYNIEGSFSGGQLGAVAFGIIIDADFSSSIPDTSTGLTVLSLTSSAFPGLDPFAIAGGLSFAYEASTDFLTIGGAHGGTPYFESLSTDDFIFEITHFLSNPSIFSILDTSSANDDLFGHEFTDSSLLVN